MIHRLFLSSSIFILLLVPIASSSAQAGAMTTSLSISGITVTGADVSRVEAKELKEDGENSGSVMPSTVVGFKQENVCFPSLYTRPIPPFSPYMSFTAGINLPVQGEQPPSVPAKLCLNGVQVFMDDPSAPNVRGYSTNLTISDLKSRDCSALPEANDEGLLIFCFDSNHSAVDADISVVATDPGMLPNAARVFVISSIVVTGIPAGMSAVPEGSPTCNEFRRRFGRGPCYGPFIADGHDVTWRIENGSFTFRIGECIQFRVVGGGCTDGANLGITRDVVAAIRDKQAQTAPVPKF